MRPSHLWCAAHRRVVPMLAAFVVMLLASAYPQAQAEAWRHVVDLGGRRGSAIGGGTGNTLYAGLTTGPVLRSDDNGLSWNQVTNGLVDVAGGMLGPKAFAVSPTGRVIRGGDNASWNNKAGSPIFVSDNAGARWNEIPLPFASPTRNPGGIGISDLVVHQGALYFSDLLSEGVWKSTDNGTSWTAVGEQLPTAPFVGFAKTYYALASAGDALLTVEATRGVFRSTDGGAHWSTAVNGIPGNFNSPLFGGRTWNGIDVVGRPDGTAFAVVDGQVYRSRDGGASWMQVGDGIIVGPNPYVPSVIQPTARKVELLGDRVFVTTTDGNPRFFEGTGLGESWTELPRLATGGETASILAQSFYAFNGALYFAASNGIHRLDLNAASRTPVLPRVTTRPSGPFGLNVGGTLQVTAVTGGTAPFTYEWRLNDLALPEQNSAQLNFTASSTNQGGALTLVVRNAAGSVTNAVGTLTVVPRAPGAVDYAFRPVVSGNTFASANVTTFAFGPDGSVYLGGSMASTTEAYTGVRKAFFDGTIDSTFVTGSSTGAGSGPGASVGPVTTLFPLGDGSVLVGAASTGDNTRYYRRLLADGSVDPAWPWPAQIAGGPRKISRLADGRLLVAGGSQGGLHRLNADGSYDTTWQGPASIGRFQQNYVSDFVVLADGRILIGGKFNDIDGTPRVGIARLLPDGPLDRTWIPAALPVGSEVNALAVLPNGNILLGGAFLTVGGQPHRNLAQLTPEGAVESSLADLIPNTSPAGLVNAFAVQPDGRVWVGGSFAAVAGRAYLFRLNTDNTVDTRFPDVGFIRDNQNGVTSLSYTPDGRLWIGSGVTEVGGHATGQLFRIFTEAEGPTTGFAGFDQTPNVGDTITLAGGANGAFIGVQWRFNGTPIPGATNLSLPLAKVTSTHSGRYDLVITSAGGTFTTAPAIVRIRGAVVFDADPQPSIGIVSNSVTLSAIAFGCLPIQYQWFREGSPVASATNRSLTFTNLQLSHAGEYSVRATGGDGSVATSSAAFLSVIPLPGSAFANFRLALFPTTTFTVFQDLALLADGRVVVGGNFATSAGGPNAFVARLLPDGAVDPSFHFDATGIGEFVALDRQSDGKIVLLVRANGYQVRRLHEDGSRDAGFADFTLDGGQDVKVSPDGGILVAGGRNLARLNPDGSPDPAFSGQLNVSGAAASFDVDPAGRIYQVGTFTGPGGVALPRVIRLQPDGRLDTSFAPTNSLGFGTVTALPDGALYGDPSGFYRFDDQGRQDLAYGWSTRLQVWDRDATGGLAGVLPAMNGDAVLRRPDGSAASPLASIKVPISFSSYSFLRIAPDGALWLALGANGSRTEPATMLFKLNGSITPLALTRGPASQTVNAGTTVQFSATATGTSRVDYQWRRNGIALPGETNATLVIPAAQPTHNGDYTVAVRNQSGTVTSRPATLVVLGLPEILSLSGDGELGVGDSLRLAANVRGVAPLSFEWRFRGVPLPGATAARFTNAAVRLGDRGDYTLVVANPLGVVTSRVVRVSVVLHPGAVVGSFAGVSAGSGMELNLLPSGDFLVDDKAYDRFGNLLFRLPFPDGTSTVLRDRIAVDAANARIYAGPTQRVRAYSLQGDLIPDYSGPSANVRLVRVEAAGTVLQSTEGPNLPLQRLDPQGALAAGFSAAAFPTLDAQPLPDGKTLVLGSYQAVVGGRFVYSTTLARLLPDGSLDAGFARSTNLFVGGGQATRLALDHLGRILVLGGTGVTNTARLVRLHSDGTRDESFRPPPINGPINALAEQRNGRLVIVGEFTSVDGQTRNLIARLHADGSHDTGFDPGTGLTLGAGQNTAFDVAILPDGEIVVTGTFDQANGQPRRGIAMLTGDTTDLYFTAEPSDVEALPGATIELVAAGTGSSPVSYAWWKDDQLLANQTAPTLRLTNVTPATAGSYHVVIRNVSGELTSRRAHVAVIVAPVITEPPDSLVANTGGEVSFTVTATGLQLAYQWMFAGAQLVNATNASLTLTNLDSTHAGLYAVTVRNLAGEVTSAPAQLRLRPTPTPTGGIPLNGIAGEWLFEGKLTERSNRIATATRGTPTLVEGVAAGQAGRFRGGVDRLQFGTPTARLGGNAYTVSFWIQPEDSGSVNAYSLNISINGFTRQQFVIFGGNDTNAFGEAFVIATHGLTRVVSRDPRAAVASLLGKWTHVSVIYRGSDAGQATNYSVALDGLPLLLENTTNALPNSGDSGNGFGTYGPATSFRLDEFRLYNRLLATDELERLRQVGPPPTKPEFTRQPAGGSAPMGGTFTLTAEATGSELFYEWYHGDRLIADATGPALNLGHVSPADAGEYRVIVSNPAGSTSSDTATLSVNTGQDAFTTWIAAAGISGNQAAPDADPDGDGRSNAAEFAHGTSPIVADAHTPFECLMIPAGEGYHAALAFQRRQDLNGFSVAVEIGSTVDFADATPAEFVSATPLLDGLERVVVRSPAPLGPHQSAFFRITVRK